MICFQVRFQIKIILFFYQRVKKCIFMATAEQTNPFFGPQMEINCKQHGKNNKNYRVIKCILLPAAGTICTIYYYFSPQLYNILLYTEHNILLLKMINYVMEFKYDMHRFFPSIQMLLDDIKTHNVAPNLLIIT